MSTPKFVKFVGFFLIALGLLAFVPQLLSAPFVGDPVMKVNLGYGRLFGVFPTNISYNLLRIAFGVWGFAASRDIARSIFFCQIMAVTYAVMTIMGQMPGLGTMFGYLPLFSYDNWLSATLAALSAFYGFRTIKWRPLVRFRGRTVFSEKLSKSESF